MSNIINNIEIRVLGQMRSGNHVIIDWLCSLYPNRSICFLNNVRHGDYDPYKTAAQMELIGFDEAKDIETLRTAKKEILIYSYEDKASLEADNIDFISSVFNEDFERNRENYIGKSKHRFDVTIIRDPFNCFASRLVLLQKRGGLGGLENMHLIKENWKAVANKVLYTEKEGSTHEIVIKYNKWLGDKLYREELSKRIMGHDFDISLDSISGYGGGSSFDRTNIKRLTVRDLFVKWHKVLSYRRFSRLSEYFSRFFTFKKNPDEFLTRWKGLADDEEYRELFADRQVFELSEAIFGEIRGTREFVKLVCGKNVP